MRDVIFDGYQDSRAPRWWRWQAALQLDAWNNPTWKSRNKQAEFCASLVVQAGLHVRPSREGVLWRHLLRDFCA